MQKDFLDSVKARLWDFKYTPFLSSYAFAWIYWNSKSILIFFSESLSVEQKISMLSYASIEYCNPLYFALFYVFLFPIASAVFYATTLWYRLCMNKIQQKIQDKTPLPQEQANAILQENRNLQKELTDTIQEMTNIKATYRTKEIELETSFESKLHERVAEQVTKKTNSLTDEKNKIEKLFNKSNKDLMEKIDLANSQQENIKNLNSQITVLNDTIKKIDSENQLLKETLKRGEVQFNEKQTDIQNKEEVINQLKLKVGNLENELKEKTALISKNQQKLDKRLEKYNKEFSTEEIAVLEAIYKNNIRNHTTLENYLKSINNFVKIPLVKLETIVKGLNAKGLIIISASALKHDLTSDGKAKVLEMFG